ncbi:MAG: flippase-like domain-containing protein, partial [Myxococcales bacterium]|nr:flippase-like domain-containing protein [Myxococcales bacterium]
VVGSHLFVGVADIANLGFALVITLSLVGRDAGLSPTWWIAALGLLGLVAAHFTYWFTGLRDRFPFWRSPKFAGLFDSIRQAEPRQYLRVFATRSLFVIGNVVGGLITLHAFGIDAPLSYSAMALTMILVGAFLPISVASFGGPQAAAEFFFHPYASHEAIAAYSIMWSMAFLLGRLGFGLIFFGTLWRGAFSARPVPGYEI